MGISTLPLVFFLFLLFFSLSSATSKSIHGSYKGTFSKVYAFGGSETDTGNSHFLHNLSTTRLSDGRLVIDFLCEALSLPPLSPYKGSSSTNFANGVNFAVAGSTALPTGFLARHNGSSRTWKYARLSFQTQIEWFNKYIAEKGGKGSDDMENALFWIGDMGVSDYISALRSSIPPRDLADMSVRSVCKLLKALLDNGAKYVVVEGLPPVGCFPICMSSNSKQIHDQMGCVAAANKGTMDHNQILQNKLEKFRKLYPNCSILYADYWNAYLTILTNPKRHHIRETFKPCCSYDGKSSLIDHPRLSCASTCEGFISWNGVHLTESMNENLADLFFDQGFSRPSFDELVRSKMNF